MRSSTNIVKAFLTTCSPGFQPRTARSFARGGGKAHSVRRVCLPRADQPSIFWRFKVSGRCESVMACRWYSIGQRKLIAPSQTSHENPQTPLSSLLILPHFHGVVLFRTWYGIGETLEYLLCHLPTDWSQWSWNAGYGNSACCHTMNNLAATL